MGVSPSLVVGMMMGKLWGGLRGGAVRVRGEGGAADWTTAAGHLFEDWCRRVASDAAAVPGSFLQMLPNEVRGSEVTDIVLGHGRRALLVEAKARLMAERTVLVGTTRVAVMEWYRGVLFGAGYHKGALPQLDRAVRYVREGVTAVERDAVLYPVVVTLEDPADHALLHEWIQEESRDRGLLLDQRTRRPTMLSIDAFEQLMTLAASGVDVFSVLDELEGAPGGRLDVLLGRHLVRLAASRRRIPLFEVEFEKLAARANARLFPGSRPP